MSKTDHQHNHAKRRTHPPTPRQLRYLRVLAQRTGTTFAAPDTSAKASREIARLQSLPSLTGAEHRIEDRALESERRRLRPASAVREEEISGYAIHATWRRAR